MIPTSRSDRPVSAAREVQGWLTERFSGAPSATMDDSVAISLTGTGAGMPGSKKVRRYTLCREVAFGGSAAVYLGVLEGAAGFRRPVAIKRIREGLPKERLQSSGLLREALLGCHIRHPNVVAILDLVQADGELLLVMEFVLGETLANLQKASAKLPLPIIASILGGSLRGLHAAHIATGGSDEPLKIVHRDVSPQNVLVGADGISRIIDFGVAKAESTEPTTVGYLKGKIGYFAPEQFLDEPLDARTDVFAAGIVLWEALAGRRLFQERNPVEGVLRFLSQGVPPASDFNPGVPRALDAVLARALQRSPEWRFESAEEFAEALESVVRPATPGEVASHLRRSVGPALDAQRALLATVQVPGARRVVLPPLASAHGSIRLSVVQGMRSPDEELTIVQPPQQRAGMLSIPDVIEEATQVQPRPLHVEPELPALRVDYHDLTKPDVFPRAPWALAGLSAYVGVLALGIVLGVVLGAAAMWQLSRPVAVAAANRATPRPPRSAPAAVVTRAASPEPVPALDRLVPVTPEMLRLDPAPAQNSVRAKKGVKARQYSKRARPRPRA